MATLVVTDGPLKGQRLELKDSCVIGRSFDADLRIDDLTVSRRHARIIHGADGFTIEDLGSGNGTVVNEDRIAKPTRLRNGDVVRLSESVFQFEEEPPAESVQVVEPKMGNGPSIMETLDINATLMNLSSQEMAQPDALRKAHERLRTVLEISNAVLTQLDMEALLNQILDRLLGVFSQADRGFIMLKGEEADALTLRASRRRGGGAAGQMTVSRSIIERALQGRVAILSADAMSDQRFAAALSVVNFGIRSMICAPIIANDQALGIIQLDTTRQDRQFTRDDLDLLTGVANQTAFAIASAQLHRQLMVQERMQRDLQIARQVQESFLPSHPPEAPGLRFVASYKAALEVGGDFYDFIPLRDGTIGLVVGDVAGKGMSAALMMARMTSDVRFFALNDPDPAQVLAKLNQRLSEAQTEGFVTGIYGVLNPATRRLTFANAAHPPPVIRYANGEVGELSEAGGLPIGAAPEAEFDTQTYDLKSGDIICMFSDGVTEAMNAGKECFGDERVRAAVSKAGPGPQAVMDVLRADIQAHVKDAYQSDDLTILCVGAV